MSDKMYIQNKTMTSSNVVMQFRCFCFFHFSFYPTKNQTFSLFFFLSKA